MPRQQQQSEIHHQPVQSSNIKTIGYDQETGELHIDFHKTGMYVYQGVHPQIYKSLMASGSKGQFIHKHIKPRHSFDKG